MSLELSFSILSGFVFFIDNGHISYQYQCSTNVYLGSINYILKGKPFDFLNTE